MKYCSLCGSTITIKIPAGDNRERHVCDACDTVHYQNPKIVAGCIPLWENRILLCKRAIEPRSGLWTLPAGFMENGESTVDAAIRETREEALANVKISSLFGVFSIPHINQVYMMFLANMVTDDFAAGQESTDVRLFNDDEIPWDKLAFPVISLTLEKYFSDKQAGKFNIHLDNIHIHPRKKESS